MSAYTLLLFFFLILAIVPATGNGSGGRHYPNNLISRAIDLSPRLARLSSRSRRARAVAPPPPVPLFLSQSRSRSPAPATSLPRSPLPSAFLPSFDPSFRSELCLPPSFRPPPPFLVPGRTDQARPEFRHPVAKGIPDHTIPKIPNLFPTLCFFLLPSFPLGSFGNLGRKGSWMKVIGKSMVYLSLYRFKKKGVSQFQEFSTEESSH